MMNDISQKYKNLYFKNIKSSDHNIRVATTKDLDNINKIYSKARLFMKNHNNPHQWRNNKPSVDILVRDIKRKNLYVLYDNDNKLIYGVFAYLDGPDPTYFYIDGKWENTENYGVIHRIASDGSHSGILKAATNFVLRDYDNIRIDTHRDNYVMQSGLRSLGYKRCGIIYLENGEERIAFHLSNNYSQK